MYYESFCEQNICKSDSLCLSLLISGLNSVLNWKAVVAAFNQEKALVGVFSVISNLQMELFEALVSGECAVAGAVAVTTSKQTAGHQRGRH